MPQPPIHFTREQRDEIGARYTAGESSNELAAAFLVSPGVILRLLNEEGVPRRRKGGSRRRLDLSEIEEMDWLYWGCGYSLGDVSREFGISVRTVRERFDRYGIPVRTKRQANLRVWARLNAQQRAERIRRGWKSLSPEEQQRRKDILLRYSRGRKVAA